MLLTFTELHDFKRGGSKSTNQFICGKLHAILDIYMSHMQQIHMSV